MRLGVLDIGSNTVHLLVVDAHPGAHPWPAYAEKAELRLGECIGHDGRLSESGTVALISAVQKAVAAADRLGTCDLLAFATSAVRDATNSATVLTRIATATGVEPTVLSGEEEAALTFLAARRWYGWSAGRLLVLDVGGGSLELAAGIDEQPDIALSLPLGAGRLTRAWFDADPPPAQQIARLRQHVRNLMSDATPEVLASGWDRPVATSKTFRTLARLTGAAPAAAGARVVRRLSRDDLRRLVGFISRMSSEALAQIDGVSQRRAHQVLAGAVVAQETMRLLDLDVLEMCPWALREGVILRRLESGLGHSTPFLAHHPREQASAKRGDGGPASELPHGLAASDRSRQGGT
jgi:exopolyphosphatase/guanosine-5'-triphosphate,3'-diphosphate pyrophosphatase